MVSHDILRDTKTCYDVVKNELSSSNTVNIVCGHHLGPFCKIVNDNDDITMPPDRVRVTCHEINAPFGR